MMRDLLVSKEPFIKAIVYWDPMATSSIQSTYALTVTLLPHTKFPFLEPILFLLHSLHLGIFSQFIISLCIG